MRGRTHSRNFEPSTAPAGSFSWWSWRPGIAPIGALFTGLPLLLLASLFFAVGLYALISGIFERFNLPGNSASGTLPGSILLLLLGSLLLPYSLFLTFGGWHDLRGEKHTMTGRVVALRTTAINVIRQGRAARPGVSPRVARAWYGLALQPLETDAHRQVMIFRLNEEMYRALHEGEFVRVVYTHHLHHVQSLMHVLEAS